METPSPAAALPDGFILYEDSVAGVSLFLPDSWVVSFTDPGQWAILQSYPEDKYVGGEGLQPGDTKCDLNIRPPGTSAVDLIKEWKANPDTTIVSEEEILLESGMAGTRLETENMGLSLSMFIDVHERAVVLTCFGDFASFDEIAGSLHESKILVDTTQSYQDSETGISVDIPGSWVVTGIVPGHRAVLQSYPDTNCELFIHPPNITMVSYAQEMRANTAITILSEVEVVLRSGQQGMQMEVESMVGRSRFLITEVNGQVVVLNCTGEFDSLDEVAVTLRAAD
jgi:hypothetical protein